MEKKPWTIIEGGEPLIAVAVHSGHDVREELQDLFAVDESQRLREEDPATEIWASVCETRLVAHRSRFEVDLNRPRGKAVYRRPEDSWGLQVWKEPLSVPVLDRSLEIYDNFYFRLREVLDGLAERHGRFVVFDLHSYNHRRGGPGAPPAPQSENPDIDLGTSIGDRADWAPVIEAFLEAAVRYDYPFGRLDIRENAKYPFGYLGDWVHAGYPRIGCLLSIEIKKFYMDEWSGELYPVHVEAIAGMLTEAKEAVKMALRGLRF
jgi:N-formylglutamate deformylase